MLTARLALLKSSLGNPYVTHSRYRLPKFTNPSIRPTWRDAWNKKEAAMLTRFSRSSESLNRSARPLPPLSIGDHVLVQNQHGSHPTKWDKSGVVVEKGDFDQYVVKVAGSHRVTLRNRRFLRKFTPITTSIHPTAPMRINVLPDQPPCQPDDVFTSTAPDTTLVEPVPPLSVSNDHEQLQTPDTKSSTPSDPEGTVVPDTGEPIVDATKPRSRKPPRRYEPETGKWKGLFLLCVYS